MLSRYLLAVLIAVAGFLPRPATGLKTAEMKLPPGFDERAQRFPVRGYGGANKGRFTVAEYGGDFTRIELRLAVFDPLFARNYGSASYSLSGAGLEQPVGAECRFKQNAVTVGVVTFDPRKFIFDCELWSKGSEPAGRLSLGEPKKEGLKQKLLAQATRRGVAELDNIPVSIESVHAYAGTRIQAPTPTGYLFSRDTVVVGALELTDLNPTVYLADSLAGSERLSVLRAAIAVSLLRDPAESPLGD
jgi:hypothetical protein